MKIAILSFYSGNISRGVETFVHELANRLVKLGHEVSVFQGGPALKDSYYKTVCVEMAIDCNNNGSYFPYINYRARKIKSFTDKVLKIVDEDTEIIFPTNGQWQSLLCKIWAKRHGAKMIIAGQSGPGIDDRLNLLTFPDVFIGLTDYQINWAKRVNPFVKKQKIPNGVDLNKFGAGIKPEKIDLPRPIILCVGAFDFWKRQDLSIKAIAKLKKGSLLLVGKGKEENKLRDLGNKLLPNRFGIMSFPYEKMPSLYRAVDLFTFPTVPWESFGIVLLEAMANGLGIVATDDPIRKEIIGDAGFFVDPTNTEEYAKILQKALDTDFGDKPRKQVEKFSWDIIARKYEKVMREML